MKEGWKVVQIKDIAKFTRGLTYSKKDEAICSSKVVLRSNNVDLSSGKLNFSELKYLQEGFDIPKEKIVKKGSLLMCMSNGSKAHLGKVALVDDNYPYAFGGFMALVTPTEDINPKYFHYALSTPMYKGFIKRLSEGANINNIKVKELELFTFLLPPLSEQEEIVTYLDTFLAKIDAIKANAEKELEEAKKLFAAALKRSLSPALSQGEGDKKWQMRTVGEVFKSYSGGTPLKSHKEYYNGGTIPWLRSGEVCQKNITSTEMFITEEGLNNSSAKFFPVDTVLIAMYGATAAQVGILKIEATSNQAVCGLLPNNSYIPEFVYYWFCSIQQDLAGQAQGGAQPNISQEKIKRVLIPVISIAEQKEIVTHLDTLSEKVRQLQSNYEKISSECDALKQAILRDTFE